MTCPYCGNNLTYIQECNCWYCYNCHNYIAKEQTTFFPIIHHQPTYQEYSKQAPDNSNELITVIVVLAITSVLIFAALSFNGFDFGDGDVVPETSLMKIDRLRLSAIENETEGWRQLNSDNFISASHYANLSQENLKNGYSILLKEQESLSLTDFENYKIILEYSYNDVEHLKKIILFGKLTDALLFEWENANDIDEFRMIVPSIEILINYCDEMVKFSEEIISQTQYILDHNPIVANKLFLSGDTLQDIYAWIDIYSSWREILENSISEFADVDPNYNPEEETIIPIQNDVNYPTYIITPQLASFFDTFDVEYSGTIDIAEAQYFYYWTEDNIQYRYDDENTQNTIPGYWVGDGRLGKDYWQSPMETYTERMGDCEDMAILTTAFYNYYGIEAYIALVNAEVSWGYDHAICVVRIGDNLAEYSSILGYSFIYYLFNDAFFMLVDNAYSDLFGTISGNANLENQFRISGILTLEEAYAEGHS